MFRSWSMYNTLLLVVTILFVVTISGYNISEWLANRNNASYMLYYNRAIFFEQSSKHLEESIITFARLSFKSDIGYRVLSALQQAAILTRYGEKSAALAIWKHIAEDVIIPRPYREVATCLAVLHGLNEFKSPNLIMLLTFLLKDQSPWRFLALEITAILTLQENDTITARFITSHLAGDWQSPDSIRNRSRSLLQAF